jgi:hypothetical protein
MNKKRSNYLVSAENVTKFLGQLARELAWGEPMILPLISRRLKLFDSYHK